MKKSKKNNSELANEKKVSKAQEEKALTVIIKKFYENSIYIGDLCTDKNNDLHIKFKI